MAEVDGLNAGYARAVLEEYLENPEAVPAEWRELFEGDSTCCASTRASHACSKCSRRMATARRPKPPRPSGPRGRAQPQPQVDETLLSRRRGRGAGQGLQDARPPRRPPRPARVRACRRPGTGTRAPVPPLTPELQAQIPARLLRVHVPGETLADVLRSSRRPTAARARTRSSTSPTTRSGSGCGRRSRPARIESRSTSTTSAGSSRVSPRWKGSSATFARRSSARSSFRSRGST